MKKNLLKMMLMVGLVSLASWSSHRAEAATCTGQTCAFLGGRVCTHNVPCCGDENKPGTCFCSSAGRYICAF